MIRATWATDAARSSTTASYYPIDGARPGPGAGARRRDLARCLQAAGCSRSPAPRRTAGCRAPPTSSSASCRRCNAAIDRAAEAAGRRPADVRRLLNVNGSFGSGTGFLRRRAARLGAAAQRADADQRDEHVHPVGGLRRRRPALRRGGRARGARARRRPARGAAEPARAGAATRGAAASAAAPLAVTPTPDDGQRLSDEQPWDESTRPTGPAPDPSREYTPGQQAAGRHLIDVHDALRRELTQLRDLIEQVARGSADAGRGALVHHPHDDPPEPLDARHVLRDLLPGRHAAPHARGPRRLPPPPAQRPSARARDRAPRGRSTDDRRPPRARRPGARRPRRRRRTTASSGVQSTRSSCSPTRCSRTSPTRSAS